MIGLDFEDDVKSAVVVAEASTRAGIRALMIGTIPIVEFGLLVVVATVLVSAPLRILRRLQ